MITVNRKFLKELSALPALQRLKIAESIIQELENPIPEIEIEWIEESERRLKAMKSGKVKTYTMEQVFGRK